VIHKQFLFDKYSISHPMIQKTKQNLIVDINELCSCAKLFEIENYFHLEGTIFTMMSINDYLSRPSRGNCTDHKVLQHTKNRIGENGTGNQK